MSRKLNKIRVPSARHAQAVPQARGSAIGPRFAVNASADVAEISLYDEIGFWGVTAGDMRRILDGISAPEIVLRINSPGGEVFDGLAIHNDLVAHPAQVRVEITGIAASIASIIAMAGDRISVAENGFMMIHNAWTIAWGDRREMADTADLLGQIDEALAQTYARRTGEDQAAIATMMDNETWMTGAGVVEAGFADDILAEPDPEAANALFDLSHFEHVPAALKRRIEDGLRASGFSQQEAKTALANGFTELPRRDVAARSHRDGGASDQALLQGTEALLARIKASMPAPPAS